MNLISPLKIQSLCHSLCLHKYWYIHSSHDITDCPTESNDVRYTNTTSPPLITCGPHIIPGSFLQGYCSGETAYDSLLPFKDCSVPRYISQYFMNLYLYIFRDVSYLHHNIVFSIQSRVKKYNLPRYLYIEFEWIQGDKKPWIQLHFRGSNKQWSRSTFHAAKG